VTAEPEKKSQSQDRRPRARKKPSAWRQQRQRLRESRAGATRRAKSAMGVQLAPVSKRWAAFKQWYEANGKWTKPLGAVLLIGLALFLPYTADVFEVPLWVELATSGSALARVMLFALFALGLNVVVGFAGLLDLGYVAFWAIGAYTAGILTGARDYAAALSAGAENPVEPEWQMWMWLLLLVALGVAVLAGVVLGSPTLRLRGDYLAIVTLGFGEIVRITANNLDSFTGGPRGIRGIPHPAIRVGGLNIEWGTLIDIKYYWLLLAFVALWIIAINLLDKSRIGRAWVAIREDEVAAAAMGVPVVRMKLAAFAIGACTAGVGGVVYAEQITFINPPTFSLIQSILILSMVVIGGMGSIAGSILGAALIVLLPEIFRPLEDYRFFLFGFALIVVMIFRPQGLLPSKRRQAELMAGAEETSIEDIESRSGAASA
jgi:branched-chain amino acid transport system permease protein